MSTLLRIDASIRAEGSHSRALADQFEKRWFEKHPDGRVLRRDLAMQPIPHLNQQTAAVFVGGAGQVSGESAGSVALSDELIAELEAADEVLVSSPVYNFNTPSTLKAWADHVIRVERTFTYDQSGFHGLLKGKAVCLVTARGGNDPGQMDAQGPFLQELFRFMGFERVEWIALEGTKMGEMALERSLKAAEEQLDAWFAVGTTKDEADGIDWRGNFSARDRAEIHALRQGQASAIAGGDAEAYAALCAEDIVLMLQGKDMVQGREAFLECERNLFRQASFRAIRQVPRRVERDGILVVETGVSEVELDDAAVEAENYLPQRKYMHVMRKTAEGWRFAVLMSNNSQ